MMKKSKQLELAERFFDLHTGPPLLILPCAWDVSSAKLFEVEGFDAIGTTSAGIAATLGYPDGQRMSLLETAEVLARIVENVGIPVSADIESGYSTDAAGAANSAKAILEAGAVGLNIEDSPGCSANPLFDISLQVEKIGAIREVAKQEQMPLFINARTDVYLNPNEDEDQRLREAIDRGNAYREAGADCVFVPDMGELDKKAIATLVREIVAPLNIIAGGSTPVISELEEIGVARVSLGPRPMRAVLASLRKISREILLHGTFENMISDTLSYDEVNAWFE